MITSFLVKTSGLEPPTPCMSSKYSNQLSYAFRYLVLLRRRFYIPAAYGAGDGT